MVHAKHKIMLVEDDPLLAELTSFRLELLDYEVTQFESCESALEAITDNQPDLIIVDLEIQGIGGLEFINRVQESPQTMEIQILAISTCAELDVVQKVHDAGAKDYLVTPYDPRILEKKITTLIETSTKV